VGRLLLILSILMSPVLPALANDSSRPAIIRASAVLESGRFPSQETVDMLQQRVGDKDALVRAAAASAMDWLPLAQRYTLLQPLITAPVKSVRMAVAPALADLPPDQLSANGRDEWIALRTEYLESLKFQGDMPEAQMNLGNFFARSGQAEEAERAYREDLAKWPDNGWSLYGLSRALEEQGNHKESAKVRKAYERVWAQADAPIGTSCLCLPE